ncbi:MAG TPA: hypothetical protein VEP67_09745 [Thiobacillaceae bacterium]|nr:hypothetical protein [Thiobacillaceae bacterium]
MQRFLLLLALFSVASYASPERPTVSGPQHLQIPVPSGERLDYVRYPAKGNIRLIWVSSERGQGEAESLAASRLAERGVEVWMIDLTFSYMLDAGRRGLDHVPPADMRALLSLAGRDKKLAVVALGRAAVPLLRAYGSWQKQEGRPQQLDFVLVHPNLYEEAEPLQEVRYLELGNLAGGHLYIMQPRHSAGIAWLDRQAEALRKEGAVVNDEVLERVREGFWARQDASAYEVEMSQKLGDLIWARLAKETKP